MLEEPYTVEYILEAIKGCDNNKCPRPDEFNFEFIKHCWDFIGPDIISCIQVFHNNPFLPKALNSAFITFVPKILATRLGKVIGGLVSPSQTASIPGRQLLDGVLVVNELIDLAIRRKRRCLLFKVDFIQAKECIDWDFCVN
ncbi:unnamed protein product [Lathyrus sativus]|nr:unnamed protein product [Lathyrus sativus]